MAGYLLLYHKGRFLLWSQSDPSRQNGSHPCSVFHYLEPTDNCGVSRYHSAYVQTRGMKVGDNSVKKKKKKRNALCNPKENIIIGLTTIKIVREICQDFSKATVFGEYTKKRKCL